MNESLYAELSCMWALIAIGISLIQWGVIYRFKFKRHIDFPPSNVYVPKS